MRNCGLSWVQRVAFAMVCRLQTADAQCPFTQRLPRAAGALSSGKAEAYKGSCTGTDSGCLCWSAGAGLAVARRLPARQPQRSGGGARRRGVRRHSGGDHARQQPPVPAGITVDAALHRAAHGMVRHGGTPHCRGGACPSCAAALRRVLRQGTLVPIPPRLHMSGVAGDRPSRKHQSPTTLRMKKHDIESRAQAQMQSSSPHEPGVKEPSRLLHVLASAKPLAASVVCQFLCTAWTCTPAQLALRRACRATTGCCSPGARSSVGLRTF